MPLFGVAYVTCGDFHDGSEKGTVSVHHICANLGKSATEILTMIPTSLWGSKLESCAGVSIA